MTQIEFLAISRWKMTDLARWCGAHSFRHAMDFKRSLQKALATYSRTHKYDAVQEKMIAIISKLEKWCKKAFIDKQMVTLMRWQPSLIDKPITAKAMARESWERLNSKASF